MTSQSAPARTWTTDTVEGRALVACLFLVWLSAPTPSWAYRPFISTDAAVADPKDIELELGLSMERENRQTSWLIPRTVINYGLFAGWEAVGEFAVRERPHAEFDVIDAALSLKGILKPGVLQDRPGISIAVEGSALLPSTDREERHFGFEGIAIFSGVLAPFTVHVNAGLGVERSTGDLVGVWGLIGELPVAKGLRLVTEVNGEKPRRDDQRNSVLLGLIWQPWSSRNLWFDAGVRRGLSRTVPDWQFTMGATFDLSTATLINRASDAGLAHEARW
jgi:hypothetical protein